MRIVASSLITIFCTVPMMIGCTGSPFVGHGAFATAPAAVEAQAARLEELSRRISELDANNRDLHTEIARHRQDLQKERDLRVALQQELQNTAGQLSEIQVARSDAEHRLQGILASTQQSGGALITANNSLQASIDEIRIPGVEVRRDGDVIRLEIPADTLFVQNTSQFRPGADQLLNQVSGTIRSGFPRQIVGIEGHTDNATTVGFSMGHHELASQQVVAVFNQLVRGRMLSSKQLFTMSHGANHPRFSNGDPAGRARNRRIELVVYPETADQ